MIAHHVNLEVEEVDERKKPPTEWPEPGRSIGGHDHPGQRFVDSTACLQPPRNACQVTRQSCALTREQRFVVECHDSKTAHQRIQEDPRRCQSAIGARCDGHAVAEHARRRRRSAALPDGSEEKDSLLGVRGVLDGFGWPLAD